MSSDGNVKVLKPNVVYTTKQGYTFTTDHYGRIVKVEANELKIRRDQKETIMHNQT